MQKRLNSNNVQLRLFVDRAADFDVTALLDPKVALLGQNIFHFPDVPQFNQALTTSCFVSDSLAFATPFYPVTKRPSSLLPLVRTIILYYSVNYTYVAT